MICLQDQERRKAVRLQPGFLHCLCQPFIRIQVLLTDKELRCGRPALLNHGNSLEPDERSTSDRLPDISSERVLRRRTFRRGVSAFHRRNSHAVPERNVIESHRRREHGRIPGKREMHAKLPGFLLYIFQRLIVKSFVCHGISSFRFSSDRVIAKRLFILHQKGSCIPDTQHTKRLPQDMLLPAVGFFQSIRSVHISVLSVCPPDIFKEIIVLRDRMHCSPFCPALSAIPADLLEHIPATAIIYGKNEFFRKPLPAFLLIS